MEGGMLQYGFVILVGLLCKGVCLQNVILTPTTVNVKENASVVLTCTTTSTTNVTAWKLNGVWSYIISINGTCESSGVIDQSSLYYGSCQGNGIFSLTIKNVNRSRHGETFACREGLNNISNNVTIYVNVPVEKVEITTPKESNITLIENHNQSFICKTSYSRPTPTVKWFMKISGKISIINTNTSDEISSDEKGFKSAKSTLNLSVNKSKQGAEIYCAGTNSEGVKVCSRNIVLNVYYAPERGPYIENALNNSIFKQKEGNKFNFICINSWGNPPPKLSWNCSGTQTNSSEEKREIRLILTWKATRDKDKVCTCISKHEVAGIQKALIRTVVLYPPTIENIKLRYTELSQSIKVNETIRIIENQTFTLMCDAKSKPEPSYKWTGRTNSKVSTITIPNNVTRENYKVTCHASNVMTLSIGNQETGNVNRSVTVEILYPPEIRSIRDKRVIEGSSVNLSCQVKYGNPAATSFNWTRELNDKQWLQQSFSIRNVSRNDSMRYTCEAKNTMVTTGNITKNGIASQNISLEVLYPPNKPTLLLVSISKLNVNITISDNLSVVENTPFTLLCKAYSLPKPNYYSWSHLAMSNNSMFDSPGLLRHDTKEVTCNVSNTMDSTDGPSKTGKNERTISIDIQYSPDIEKMYNISSEEGTSVNFSCPVINGNPKRTTVIWIRSWDGKHWNGENFTLKNISRTDSAEYTCKVNNTMNMTGGILKEGNKSKSIELNVFYKAKVFEYFAANISDDDKMTIAENRTVNLRCRIEGNPTPEGEIFGPSQFNMEKDNTESYTIVSATFSATCLHKGIYTCRGFNAYNNKKHISERNITLYVTCSPRPDPIAPLQNRIKTYTNKVLIVTFTVLAYPEPNNFSMSKYNGQSWKAITNSSNFEISIAGLDIFLTIRRVSEEDYGKYNFTVTNEFGKYEHIFYVEHAEEDSQEEFEQNNPPTNYGLVIGLPLAMIVIIITIVVGISWYRKRITGVPGKLIYQNLPFTGNKRNMNKKVESQHTVEAYSEELQDIDDVPHFFTEPTEYYNSPEKIEQIERIKVSELCSYVSEKSYESFGIDYQKLPSGIQKPCTFARKPENLPLNRYNGIYPYDHSRVQIPTCPDFFINACYIDGYKRKKAYIASLGPTTKTTSDFRTFWQMVWHEETDVIVMLTNLNEPSGMKCEQYWPPDGSDMDYGEISVINKSSKVFAEYTIRTFQIIKNGKKRNVTHLHFTAWPDKTVPEDATCFLEFRRRMRSVPTSSKGPVIVHCSAGIGRTGTLIAIDRLIEEGKDLASVNVYECVEKMRDQRVKMVQTLEQYVYIYKALVNALVFDSETISQGRFVHYVEQENDAFYKKQLKQLSQSIEKDRKDDSDARAKHMRLINYNRQGADIPGFRFRVMLCLTRQGGDHDYINAVYINTFEKKDFIIIAQTPLPDTVEDFLSLIYNESCNFVVTMEDLTEPGTMIGQYMSANNHSRSFGNFTVSCSQLETKDQYIIRQIKIKYNRGFESKEKVVYHFQYTQWIPGQETPVSARDFLNFIEKVENYDREFGDEYSHILVHCLKANERSGLFCAVKILKEKMKEEKEVNVVNVLRHLRTRRPTAITCMEQIKFCYQAVSTYIKMHKR